VLEGSLSQTILEVTDVNLIIVRFLFRFSSKIKNMMESDMATSKPQFDALIGGTQNVPLEFSVGRFAAARAQEIAALTQAIGKYNVIVT
jgi:hypothetical protein